MWYFYSDTITSLRKKLRPRSRFKKKTRTRVQVEDIKLRFFKNLFLRFKSRYLYYDLQNKII